MISFRLDINDKKSLALLMKDEEIYGVEKKEYKLLKKVLINVYSEFGLYDIDRLYGSIINNVSKFFINNEREKFIEEIIIQIKNIKKNINDYRIIYPINNLHLPKGKKIQVGKVTFYNITDYRIKKLFKPSFQKYNSSLLVKDFKKEYHNKVCAEVSFSGEGEVARIFGYYQLKEAINILKFFSDPREIMNFKYIGTFGDISTTQIDDILIIADNSDSITFSSSKKGPLFPFNIGTKRLELMKNEKFLKIHKLILKEDKTKMDHSMLSAINWIGEAINSDIHDKYYCIDDNLDIDIGDIESTIINHSLGEAYLRIMIALESLLIKKNEETISKNISERISYLISKKSDDRIIMEDMVRKFYEKRSIFVHNGKNNIHISDFIILIGISKKVIITLLDIIEKENIANHEELIYYINKIKYS